MVNVLRRPRLPSLPGLVPPGGLVERLFEVGDVDMDMGLGWGIESGEGIAVPTVCDAVWPAFDRA